MHCLDTASIRVSLCIVLASISLRLNQVVSNVPVFFPVANVVSLFSNDAENMIMIITIILQFFLCF